jgi:hypothetical protein
MADKVIVMVVIAPEANAEAFQLNFPALVEKFNVGITAREIDVSSYEASGDAMEKLFEEAFRNRPKRDN